MSDQYLGEIRAFGGSSPPDGWAFCNGQLLPIARFTALFSLLGTSFGGDGKSTFALPDLRGQVPLDFGQGPGLSDYVIGETGGETAVALNAHTVPPHTHAVNCVGGGPGDSNTPVGNLWSSAFSIRSAEAMYAMTPGSGAAMNEDAISTAGAIEPLPHENRQPYLALNFCIALTGVFPQPG
jgi:microcystin-dependent protein